MNTTAPFDLLEDEGEGETTSFALSLAFDAGDDAGDLPLVVALHARGRDAAGAVGDARSLFGSAPDILAPQAARPCNPFQSNLLAAATYAGFSWYLGDDARRPEAASFGDALAQIESLTRRLRGPVVLCGDGQGAVLAVTLAAVAPSSIVGVHAKNGALASVDGWELPRERLDGVGFLISGADAPSSRLALEERGASVTIDDAQTGDFVAGWLQRRGASSRSRRRD